MTSPAPPRWLHLDWLRIIAFGLLVPYHVGMVFVSWPYHVKIGPAVTALEPWLRLASPWRMDLLFLVSGAATAFMLQRQGASNGLLSERLRRLLWPLLVGVLVVVPPQAWVEVQQRFGFAGGYGEFMRLYLTGYGGFCDAPGRCLILPTWNHLWYLPYLACYTALLWATLRRWPHALDNTAQAVTAWLARRSRMAEVWLLLPVLPLLAGRWLLAGHFPPSHALVDDWMLHSQHGLMFLLGALLARTPALRPLLVSQRWVALAWAFAAWWLLVWGLPAGSAGAWKTLANSVQQWGAIVAALGFADRHLQRDGRWRRLLGVALFPLYILHQTLIVLGAWLLARWLWPWPVQAITLVLGTFALGLLGAWWLGRWRWLRPAVGMKPLPAWAGRPPDR